MSDFSRSFEHASIARRQVPLNIAIRETSDAGSPIVAASPSSEVAMVYKAIAVRLAAKLQDWTSSGAGAGPKITIR